MIVLHREILVDADETAAHKKSSKPEGEETNKKKGSTGNPDAIMSRISAVETKLDATNSMLQDTLSSILQGRELVAKGQLTSDMPSSNYALEARMAKLEDKVDMMVVELRNFFSSFASTRPSS